MQKLIKPLLVGLLLFHLVSNLWILSRSRLSYCFDERGRVEDGYELFQRLTDQQGSFQNKLDWILSLDGAQGHPPFFEIIEAFAWKLLKFFGLDDVHLVIWLSGCLFLFMLLLSVYGIGSTLYDNRVGLLAAFLVSVFPLIFAMSRVAMLDLPLTAMVTLAFYFLIRTQKLISLRYCVLFGLVAGFAQWTKEGASVFILPIFLAYCAASLKWSEQRARTVTGFLIAFVVFTFVAGSLYLRKDNQHVLGLYKGKFLTDQGIPFYFYGQFFLDIVGRGIFILSLPFLFGAFFHVDRRRLFLLAWLIVPLLLFNTSTCRVLRFILPIAPAFALILAQQIMQDRWRRPFRNIVVCAVFAIGVGQYVLYNSGVWRYSRGAYADDAMTGGRLGVTVDPYSSSVDELVDLFKQDLAGTEDAAVIFSIFNVPDINGTLSIKLSVKGVPVKVVTPLELDEVAFLRSHWKGRSGEILYGDYVLDKTGYYSMPLSPGVESMYQAYQEDLKRFRDQYSVLARVPVYDGSEVVVYKRKEMD